MDIKSIVRTIVPLVNNAQTAKRRTETEATTDRDANGRQEQAGDENPRRKFSAEEIAEAMDYLRGLQGVKENNLTVRLAEHDDIRVIFVEDHFGKVVRRIPEAEVGSLLKSKNNPEQKKNGNLLNKTA